VPKKEGNKFFGLACVEFMFKAHPEAGHGWLTKHKTAMISNRFLGAVSVSLGFHKRVRGDRGLGFVIDYYSAKILLARENAEAPNFWTDLRIVAPPKVLPDVLEAFIGALFSDPGGNYGVVEGFFNSYVHPSLLGGHVALR
jgi:endoribonuclease Dicer